MTFSPAADGTGGSSQTYYLQPNPGVPGRSTPQTVPGFEDPTAGTLTQSKSG
jgi:hypothetical protein